MIILNQGYSVLNLCALSFFQLAYYFDTKIRLYFSFCMRPHCSFFDNNYDSFATLIFDIQDSHSSSNLLNLIFLLKPLRKSFKSFSFLLKSPRFYLYNMWSNFFSIFCINYKISKIERKFSPAVLTFSLNWR